ncbi:MAG: aromatic-ring-hydroxylating dioxygenase subunit beta [Pseudomonadota bacterium]
MKDLDTFPSDPLKLQRAVEAFLFKEARLQDSHDYDGWDALWEDDAIYWVPANGADIDPTEKMSIIYDNRSRIRVRVDQLKTGRRHTQTPRSELARIVSNVEITDTDQDELTAAANVLIYEENLRGSTLWAARNTYKLRWRAGDFCLYYKKVALVNAHKPIYTLSFLV